MERSPIAVRIEELIQVRSISLKELAEALGVQRSSLSHILSGRNKPSLDFILKLLQAFPDVSEKWLLHGRGERDLIVSSAQSSEDDVTVVNLSKFTPVTDELSKDVTSVNSTEKVEYKSLKDFKSSELATKNKSLKQIILVYSDNSFELLSPDVQE